MKQLMKLVIVTGLATISAGIAQAQRAPTSKRIVLNYYGEHLRGSNILKLKQKARQDLGVNLTKFKIQSIKLVAKTKKGHGTAQLKVGPKLSQKKIVMGNSEDFFYDEPYTFDHVRFKAPKKRHTDQGVLQIILRGNFKIKKVVIIATKVKRPTNRRVKQGWDVDPSIARGAINCHKYTLKAVGGRGSARIMSLPGKNYIQTNGTKRGFVCFNGYPKLELGKLSNIRISVKLSISGVGNFNFSSGDRGTAYINNWFRTYKNM